jgi:hypothetical protein
VSGLGWRTTAEEYMRIILTSNILGEMKHLAGETGRLADAAVNALLYLYLLMIPWRCQVLSKKTVYLLVPALHRISTLEFTVCLHIEKAISMESYEEKQQSDRSINDKDTLQ